MPPKPKFTKEEIVQAALLVVSKKGIEQLTARELGHELGSSARPIFTVFTNMEELSVEVKKAAMDKFENYAKQHIENMPEFKQVGMKMILFAIEEPKLYQLLFMQEHDKQVTFEDVFGELGVMADVSIKAIENDYGLNEEKAKILFENVWIYTFGIGALCATKACTFSIEEIGNLLTVQFQAMIKYVTSM